MYKQSFDIGVTPLTITSEKKIKEKYLDQIFRLIQFVKYDFNHKIHNSSSYRLNDTKKEVYCPLSKEFIYFLKQNHKFSLETKELFNPFSIKNDDDFPLEKILVYSKAYVVKKADFVFDSSLLLQQFLIDTVYDLLKAKKIKTFLVNTQNYFSASGKKEWNISMDIDSDVVFEASLKNAAIGLNFNKEFKEQKPEKFGGITSTLNPKFIIFQSSTAIENKVYAEYLKNLKSENEYKHFAKKNNQKIIVFDLDNKKYEFS